MSQPVWLTNSGKLLSETEGNSVAYSLQFSGTPTPSITIISGELPSGLVIDNLGNIVGTLDFINMTKTFTFTIRLENVDGFADNTFSIEVLNIAPNMSPNGGSLGSFKPNSVYNGTDISVNDPPGNRKVEIIKTHGRLPTGIELNSFGNLYGVFEDSLDVVVYNFGIRAIMDGGEFIDQDFSITVDPNASQQGSVPVWLTPAGLLGQASASVPFSAFVKAESLDGNAVTYASIGLPAGLTINPSTGEISGTPTSTIPELDTFSVTATSDGIYFTSRLFSINLNDVIVQPIEWVTPAGNIGDLKEGVSSILGVKATTEDNWLRYELVSGSLPNGTILNVNTGDIWGTPFEQVSSDTVFTFEVRAYNSSSEIFRTFSLTLVDNLSVGATRVYAGLYGKDKLLWIDLFTSPEIVSSDLYREGDANFGVVEKPKILVVSNLNNPTPDDIFNELKTVRRTYLNLGHVEVAQAKIGDEVIYEVLYRRIFDDSAGADMSVTNPNSNQTVNPGSLTNIRQRLLELGTSGDDILPLWMTEYFPCIEFAYVKPGKGQNIANKINATDVQLKKMYQGRVRVDRFVMEPLAEDMNDPLNPPSFEPQYILFDNKF